MAAGRSLFAAALLLAVVVGIIVQSSSAFAFPPSSQGTHHATTSSSCLYSSGAVKDNDQHSHSLLWERTLEVSPDSYVNPAIELSVRPPDEGGTGILAVEDVKKDTVVLRLPLEQVGMIDAASILDTAPEGEDAVFDKLNLMWKEQVAKEMDEDTQDDGKRLAVLVGIIAHLQLTRYKDKTASTAHLVKEGHALEQSRRLEQLLQGTMAQTNARQLRAGVGLVVREWSAAFLKEHSGMKQSEILNAIFSAFTAVLSRSFGDAAGRDLDGAGRMLVPLVDMLNHDSEEPNVSWKWHVGEGDEEKIKAGRGNVSVTTVKDVKKGEELYKCYGWGPAWDIATNYGFVPRLQKERWECSAIPLFPAVLDLAPDKIATPNQISKDETSLDLLLESNYGVLVKAVQAAVDAANEIEARQNSSGSGNKREDQTTDRPSQLDRLEVLSLFRPPPALTANDFPFARRQPCVVVGTKIGASRQITSSIKVLPAYRAAACAIAQLRLNHKNGDPSSSIQASQMSSAAASLDKDNDWDEAAQTLMRVGINDRIQTIERDGKAANAWLGQIRTGHRLDENSLQHRQFRYEMSSDIREAELNVLQTLDNELKREADKNE
ncbi:N-lysine methyltransferase [Skeletonema marinoi]|uniref:N-lysine methyltransferase n=1 Tax=Skeletonema marinoi TaxID=267567 RepID=A0AAD8YGI3_9STRA|nr:N-lysine methyltransferase [Skeletonema marinoi]